MIASCHRFFGFLVGLLTVVPAAFGELNWDNTTVEQTVWASAGRTTGVFRFRNAGEAPVTITAVRPACGCTTVDLPKKTFAPGEGGELAAVYEFGTGANGKQHKTVAVTTDDSAVVELNLEVTITEEFEYSPRLLLWGIGDPLNEKAATFLSKADRRIAAVEISSIGPNAQAVARVVPQPGGYQILAHPVTTQQVQQVVVSGTVTLEHGAQLPFSIYLLVR
jgi:hypothetical protein